MISSLGFAGNLHARPLSGNYGSLLIATDSAEHVVSGYYEDYTGWDPVIKAPRFSCIFYLKGSLNSSNKIKIKAWFQADTDPSYTINGYISLPKNNNILSIHLDTDPGGCWNVQHFADKAIPSFKLIKQRNWIDIRIASSDRTYFYAKPNLKDKKKAYVIKGNVLKILAKKRSWLHAEYKSDAGKVTKGWIRESDLFPNTPPS